MHRARVRSRYKVPNRHGRRVYNPHASGPVGAGIGVTLSSSNKLTPLDDYLIHQTPDVLARVFTSDHNFFERYYFGAVSKDLQSFLMVTMAVYPNRGFKEAAIGFVHEGKEHIVRGSTHLNSDRFNTAIGPITVQVVEGLKTLRISVEPNQWGLSADLTFEGRHAPHLETRNFVETGDHVTQNYLRFTQMGRYTGTVTAGGKTVEFAPETWVGQRDHSWGIRGSGTRDANHAWLDQTIMATGWLWTWAPMQFDDYCLHWSVTEDGKGQLLKGAGGIFYPQGSDVEALQAASWKYDLQFVPGTRRASTGQLSMTDENGKEWKVSMKPGVVFYMSTVGYGGDWAQGVYKGDNQVDGLVLDLTDPSVIAKIDGLTETACEFRCGDDVGYGAFEILAIPPLEQLGFTREKPVA